MQQAKIGFLEEMWLMIMEKSLPLSQQLKVLKLTFEANHKVMLVHP